MEAKTASYENNKISFCTHKNSSKKNIYLWKSRGGQKPLEIDSYLAILLRFDNVPK